MACSPVPIIEVDQEAAKRGAKGGKREEKGSAAGLSPEALVERALRGAKARWAKEGSNQGQDRNR